MSYEQTAEKIREELESSNNPLFFFHDDGDGLCSFLLMYKHINKGKGIIVKATPHITKDFLRHIESNMADKVFILDIALVDQEFIDNAGVPVFWVDHHQVLDRKNVTYLNPRMFGKNVPASRACYDIVKENMWISAVGCIADWHLPDFIDKFIEQYPEFLEKKMPPEEVQHSTKLGELVRKMSFNLKGKSADVHAAMKIMTRIDSPDEIINGTSSRGRFLLKRAGAIEKIYFKLLGRVLKHSKENPIIFIYDDSTMSLSAELSNELIYRFPEKVILIGRERGGEVKFSMRSAKLDLNKLMPKFLEGLEGRGGGHEYAVGVVIKKEGLDKFIENVKKSL